MSELRDETATKRLRTAAARDSAAEDRDRAADARDHLAHLRDAEDELAHSDDILLKAERLRASAASDRARAAEDRAKAAQDRKQAAMEREQALEAQTRARHALVLAATDELTGISTREAGLATIAREMERAGRTGVGLVLAFIAVDALEQVNATQGRAAGDQLLQLVAMTLRASVRTYDVIVRYGGNEFLCAMPNLTRVTGGDRMKKVAVALSATEKPHSIAVGLAEYEPGEELDELIGRARDDLQEARRVVARAAGEDPGSTGAA